VVRPEEQLELLGEVLDGRDLLQDFLDPFRQQPVEGLALDPHEIGKGQGLLEHGEAHTFATRNQQIRQQKSPLLGTANYRREKWARGRRHGNPSV